MHENVWEKYADKSIKEILLDLYQTRMGNTPKPNQSVKTLLLEICSFYDDLIANLPGSVYWKDKEGKYHGCNNNMLAMFGLTKQTEVIGRTEHDLGKLINRSKSWDDEIIDDDQKVFQSGKAILNKLEEPFVDATNRTWVQITNKVPIKNRAGEVILVLGIAIDFSEHIKLEKQLAEKNKELKAVLEKYRQFVENQEHDVRTPYVGIIGLAEILSKKDLPEDVKKYPEYILQSANALLKYNDEMLAALAIDKNSVGVIKRRFNLPAMVEQVYQMNVVAAKAKGLQYDCFIDDNMPTYFKSDEKLLKTILLNLISNAIRFTHEGAVTISVKLLKEEDKKIYSKFTVKDTGMGIPAKKQQDIYELFYKVKPSNSGGDRGRGLGLALTHKYVEEMDGELNLTSTLGEGSKFSVILPFDVALDQEPD